MKWQLKVAPTFFNPNYQNQFLFWKLSNSCWIFFTFKNSLRVSLPLAPSIDKGFQMAWVKFSLKKWQKEKPLAVVSREIYTNSPFWWSFKKKLKKKRPLVIKISKDHLKLFLEGALIQKFPSKLLLKGALSNFFPKWWTNCAFSSNFSRNDN